MTSDYEIIMDTHQNVSTQHQVDPEVIPAGTPDAPVDRMQFDYGSLDPNDRAIAIEATAKIRLHGSRAAESIVAIGEELARVKAALPHGFWLPWLAAEFGWHENTARNFINVWKLFKSTNFVEIDTNQIDASALFLLARPSTPHEIRVDAIEKANAGERVTHASVKAQLDDLKSRLAEQFPEDEPAAREAAQEPTPVPLQPIDVDPEKQAAFRLDANLGGRLADFGLVNEAPLAVAQAVKPVMRSKRRDQIRRLIAWLEQLLNHLEEQDV